MYGDKQLIHTLIFGLLFQYFWQKGRQLLAATQKICDNRGLPLVSIPMKRTYQASKVRRARTHGFLVRMKTRGGRAVINARRAKGRKRLAV